MYYQIKKGEEYNIFHHQVILSFHEKIANEILAYIEKNKRFDPAFLGGMGFNNVPLLDGRKLNTWIEYNAKALPNGMIDAGIHQCIIYDELPDFVLDRYNAVKQIIQTECTVQLNI